MIKAIKTLLQFTLEDVLSNQNKKHDAKPTELKEEDPILDAFKQVNNQEDLAILLKADSKNEKKK